MRSKQALKNTIASILQQFFVVISGFIIPRLIIGSYGSSVNGLISSITQFLAYITLFEAGMGRVVKAALYKPIAKKDKNEINNILKAAQKFFKIISAIFIVYLIILCFVYPNIVNSQFETGFTVSLILIIAISTFAEYFFGMVYRLFLQAEQKTYVTSTIHIITTIINTVLVIVLIKYGASIQVVKLGSAIIFVMRPILQNIYVRKKYDINLKNSNSKYELKQKWDALSQHIAAVIGNNINVAVLTIFSNTKEISVYTVYNLIINALRNLLSSLLNGVEAGFGNMIAKNERENLNKTFRTYELFYFSLITFIYSVTMIMILPFVDLYTQGVTDVNYHRTIFSFIIVITGVVWAIRIPYDTLTLVAGHFKETRIGAWVEVAINVVLSVILTFEYGLNGVGIGMLVSTLVRTIEFMYHTSKYILKRRLLENFKRIMLLILEMIIIIPIGFYISKFITINSYVDWIMTAIIVSIVSFFIIGIINGIIYRKDLRNLLEMIKKIFKRKEVA